MTPIWKDTTGTPISPGDRVAYNKSGDVVFGRVRRITPGGTFIIEQEGTHASAWVPAPHVSRVKRAQSVLVVSKSAGCDCG